MFDRLKAFGRRKVPAYTAILVIGVFLMGGVLMAATGSGTVDHLAKTLYAQYLKPLQASVKGVTMGHYWLTIGDENRKTTSGVSMVGMIAKSGATETPGTPNIAILGGVTSQIAWGTMPSGVSPSLNTQLGASGWFLTHSDLLTYQEFLVENSFPISGSFTTSYQVTGATWWSDQAAVARAKAGNTIYLPTLNASLNGKTWRWTNQLGTTAFVLYDPVGRINNNGVMGTTQAPSAGTFLAGASTIPVRAGDSVTLRAIYRGPSTSNTSGWYVVDIRTQTVW